MSEFRRYLPLPDLAVEANITGVHVGGAENRTTLVRQLVTLFEPTTTPLGILAMIVLSAVIVLFLITIWYGGEVAAYAKQYVVKRFSGREVPAELVEYTYSGIKLVLRKYYLRLRDIVGCSRCTPRELAIKRGRKEYEKFAQLYEDVVYGSKEPPGESSTVLASLDGSI